LLTVRKAETVCPACRRTFRNGDGPATSTASPEAAAADRAMISMTASLLTTAREIVSILQRKPPGTEINE
jgi:hypothetical protein